MKELILPLLLCFSLKAHAQQITGSVKDSTGAPVPFATINLRNDSSNTIIAYAVASNKGIYTLPLPAGMNHLIIEARSIGYQLQIKKVTSVNIPLNFILTRLVNQLEGVEIKSSRPVLRTSGDTLSYKVSDFSSAQDRVIGDVIKRLPGITVAADGQISYNNKPVSGVYIGGDNLLDDKYNIATTTIPQGAVDQVQVIENHQPIKALRNKVVSDDVALNLSFKKDAKVQVVGQESIGAGLPGKYNVDVNAMLFKDKYKGINYLRANNTGSELQRDLVSHHDTKNETPATLLSMGTINAPALSKDRYLFNQSGILHLNNLANLKNGTQLRLNAYYLHDIQRQDYNQQTTVILPGDTVHYSEVQRTRVQPDLWHSQVTLNINRDKYYLNNSASLDLNRTGSYADLNTNETLVRQVLQRNTRNFTNELNWMASLKSTHMIQVYSYINYYSGPEKRSIGPDYNVALFNDSLAYPLLVQQVNIPAWYTDNYLSYKVPVHLFTLSYKVGFSMQSQKLTADLYAVRHNNEVWRMDSAVNELGWSKKKLYAAAAYDLNTELLKINLTLPVIWQQINYADKLYALDTRLSRLFFNPQLKVKYMTSAENFISLLYNFQNETGSIADVYHGYILSDYRTLYANNSNLTEIQNHLAAAGFSYRKAITMFFFSAHVLYNYIRANNITSGIITDNMQRKVVLPFANGNSTWTINGSVSKYSFLLHTTFSGAIQWKNNHAVQIQNNLVLPFRTNTGSWSVGTDTKVNEALNISYQASFTQTHSSVNRIGQVLQQAAVNYIPITDLQFKLSGEHYYTRQQGNPDLSYFFTDIFVKYRAKKWKADLELSAVNFLNIKTYEAVYFSANTVVTGSYGLPGRILLLKVMFKI